MKSKVFLFVFLCSLSILNSDAQTLIAEKGSRVLQFEKGKKYRFHYTDSIGQVRSINAKLDFLDQRNLLLRGNKRNIELEVGQLVKVNHFRSTGNTIGGISQMIIGPLLTASFLNEGAIESGALRAILVISGIFTSIDGVLLITGAQTSGYYGPNPSKRRGFTFEIK